MSYPQVTVSRYSKGGGAEGVASGGRAACLQYDWEDDCYDFAKFYLVSDENSRPKELFGRLKDMEIIDRGDGEYECVPRGHSKATAIDLVLKHYGISQG